jgi:hypothetical protein
MNKRKSQPWDDPEYSPEAIARRTGHDVEKVRASLAGLQQLGGKLSARITKVSQPSQVSRTISAACRSVSPVKASAARSEGAGRSVGFGKFLVGLA